MKKATTTAKTDRKELVQLAFNSYTGKCVYTRDSALIKIAEMTDYELLLAVNEMYKDVTVYSFV